MIVLCSVIVLLLIVLVVESAIIRFVIKEYRKQEARAKMLEKILDGIRMDNEKNFGKGKF